MFTSIILPNILLIVFLGIPMAPLAIAWRQVMKEDDSDK